jgi:hypothetical protein
VNVLAVIVLGSENNGLVCDDEKKTLLKTVELVFLRIWEKREF